MKYKLINLNTKEEHLCDKVTIDGFDYYVSDEKPEMGWRFYYENDNLNGVYGFDLINQATNRNRYKEKSLIACNNPNIDIPKVVDEVGIMAFNCYEELKKEYYSNGQKIQLPKSNKEFQAIGDGFIIGYNKSQETHPFSEEDMIEFAIWRNITVFNEPLTPKGQFQLWKEQQTKIVYYN